MRCAIKSNKISFTRKSLLNIIWINLFIPFTILLLTLSCQELSFAQNINRARPQTEEVDGDPTGYYWKWIFDNGTLTDNTDGTVTHSIDGFGALNYLKLDCTNDPLTDDLQITGGSLLTDTSEGVFAGTAGTDAQLLLSAGCDAGGVGFVGLIITGTGQAMTFVDDALNSISLAPGSVIDSTGTIDFDNEDLTTTGTITADTGVFGTLAVGHSNPTVALDVIGSGLFSGSVIVDNTLSVASWLRVGSTVAPTVALDVTGDVIISGTLTPSGTIVIPSDTNGSVAGTIRYNSTTVGLEYHDGSNWHDAGSPKFLEIGSTTVAEGNFSITGFANKALIKWVEVTTSATSWDLTIYSDDGYSTDAFQIVNDRNGNYNVYLDYPYEDDDASSEFHYTFTDNIAANTHDIKIRGYQLR